MNMLLVANEVAIRLSFFLGILLSMALWEAFAPRRILSQRKPLRWFNNLGLTLFHKVPLLWRLHRMHHTDLDITTGARFHPLEILISMAIKMGIIVMIGAPAWSVILFEVLLNGTAMFNHGNIALGLKADRVMRLLVVTPDMHRVHHSVIIKETDSNFGFNFPWWDRLFGTYRGEPTAGHAAMTIGLANYRDPKWLRLHWMLIVPFARQVR